MDNEKLFDFMLNERIPPEELDHNKTAAVFATGGGDRKTSALRVTGYPWRIRHRIKLACVTGEREFPWGSAEEVLDLIHEAGGTPLNMVYQGYAAHTQEQAVFATKSVEIYGSITAIEFVAPEYHAPRFALTCAKQMSELIVRRKIRIGVFATRNPVVPPTGTATSQTKEEELLKFPIYQQRGHMATADEWIELSNAYKS